MRFQGGPRIYRDGQVDSRCGRRPAAPARLSPADGCDSADSAACRGRAWPRCDCRPHRCKRWLGGLGAAVGLFLIVAWIMRRGMPKGSGVLPREVVELLGRAPLAGRHQLHLLRLGSKLLLVSMSQAGVETLAEVTDPAGGGPADRSVLPEPAARARLPIFARCCRASKIRVPVTARPAGHRPPRFVAVGRDCAGRPRQGGRPCPLMPANAACSPARCRDCRGSA